MAGRGSKPGERRGGRKKGTPNKTTAAIKAVFEAAFSALQKDGKTSLEAWAKANLTEFYKLAARMIPTTLTGEDGKPFEPMMVNIRFTDTDGKDITEEMERKQAGGPGTPERPAASPPASGAPAVFHEYPKWVNGVLCRDAGEERDALHPQTPRLH